MIVENRSPDQSNGLSSRLVADQMAKDLIRLGMRMNRRFQKPSSHDEAAYEEAVIEAVLRAMRTHDPARGASLEGYCAYLVSNALLRTYGTQKLPAGISVCSLSTPLSEDGGTLEDLLPGDAPSGDDALLAAAATDSEMQFFDAVHAAMSELPGRWRDLITARFWQGLELPAAAREIRMPLQTAKQIERQALALVERSLVGRCDLSFAL